MSVTSCPLIFFWFTPLFHFNSAGYLLPCKGGHPDSGDPEFEYHQGLGMGVFFVIVIKERGIDLPLIRKKVPYTSNIVVNALNLIEEMKTDKFYEMHVLLLNDTFSSVKY